MSAMEAPLLSVRDLKVHFAVRGGREKAVVKAVDGLSFEVPQGRTVALVGESGCGKSTTAYAILGLEPITSGSVSFAGRDISRLDRRARRALAGEMQIVFQDPSAALDPKMGVADSIAEPLAIVGMPRAARRRRVAELLDLVGLAAVHARRTPDALSGGQRQRVVVARALALSPKLVILDEPVSALDVSIRSQILNLLEDMKARYGLTLIFIAHDLAVVKAVSDRVAVMYLGKLCEIAPTEMLFARPAHPYTSVLLQAIPLPDPDAKLPESVPVGEPPSPLAPPSGCRFRTRCARATPRCAAEEPTLREVAPGQFAACHFPLVA
jgi:oligopeptide/dipeptide ABC transporter ATP-binding protein